jgi:hypothetical protein
MLVLTNVMKGELIYVETQEMGGVEEWRRALQIETKGTVSMYTLKKKGGEPLISWLYGGPNTRGKGEWGLIHANKTHIKGSLQQFRVSIQRTPDMDIRQQTRRRQRSTAYFKREMRLLARHEKRVDGDAKRAGLGYKMK